MEGQKQLKMILNIVQWAIIVLGISTALYAYKTEEVGAMMWIVYISIGICVLAGVGFGIMQFVSNISKSKSSLISLGAFVLLIILAYGMAGSEVLDTYPLETTESESKLASALIIGMYITGGAGILAALYSAIKGVIK